MREHLPHNCPHHACIQYSFTADKKLFFSGLVWSMTVRQSALTMRALMDSNANWWSADQEKNNFMLLLVRGVRGHVWSASLGRNDAMYQTRPRKPQTSVKLVGIGQSKIFWIFDVFGSIPQVEIQCPRKSIFVRKKSHFFGLQNRQAVISDFITMLMCFTCFATVFNQITILVI